LLLPLVCLVPAAYRLTNNSPKITNGGNALKVSARSVTVQDRVREQDLITISELAPFRSHICTAVCSSLGGVSKLHRLQKRLRVTLSQNFAADRVPIPASGFGIDIRPNLAVNWKDLTCGRRQQPEKLLGYNTTTLCTDYHSFIHYSRSYMFRHPYAIYRERPVSL
jgi:hypothetical protein